MQLPADGADDLGTLLSVPFPDRGNDQETGIREDAVPESQGQPVLLPVRGIPGGVEAPDHDITILETRMNEQRNNALCPNTPQLSGCLKALAGREPGIGLPPPKAPAHSLSVAGIPPRSHSRGLRLIRPLRQT